MHEELADRDDVVILAVNGGQDTAEVAQKYWSKSGFDFPAVMDLKGHERDIANALGVKAFPTNLVIGPDGRVRFASVGFNEPVIRKYLGL